MFCKRKGAKMYYRASALLVLLVCVLAACVSRLDAADSYTNSIGMKLIRVEPGTFPMGQQGEEKDCDWDEQPVHKVRISKPFYMSETEVTVEQFRQFRPDFEPTASAKPYVAGVSWYDATAFCKWLSNKEGIPYRLPTEAEWEYACRAGTTTPFSSGNKPPEAETANPWSLRNMHTGVREWCLDWHGEYPLADQVDPIGPEKGMTKVVRGGGMDSKEVRL
jgi:formylglycine-generating enzyme required for sulfatase activity